MKEGGITTMGLLGIVFIVLKLTNTILWSWWIVTMPFWIGIVFALLAGATVLIAMFISSKVRNKKKKL